MTPNIGLLHNGSEILKLIGNHTKGTLDGTPFAAVSLKGVGKKAFVIKGWVDTKAGPAVRFRAPWGELGDGEMFYQPTPQDHWQDTVEDSIDFKGTKLTIKFTREDGTQSTAEFSWS